MSNKVYGNQGPGASNIQSQADDTEVTDEKLFLESTGFGEPKHVTQDYEDKEGEPSANEQQDAPED